MGYSWIFILPMVISALVGAVAGFSGSWLTFRTQRRAASGRVETSTASEVWTAVERQYDRMDKELTRMKAEITELRGEVGKLRDERDGLRQENVDLRVKQHELELEMMRLRAGAAMAAVTATPQAVTTTTTIHPANKPPANEGEGGAAGGGS
jgi:TolA-binding protein